MNDLNDRIETLERMLERRNKAIDKLLNRVQELEGSDPYEQYLHDVSRETVEEMQREERCAVFTSRDVKYIDVQKGLATVVIHVQVSPEVANNLFVEMWEADRIQHCETTQRDQNGQTVSWNASGVES